MGKKEAENNEKKEESEFGTDKKNIRLGFVYDQAKCIGCNACQMACKDKNNLEHGMFFRRAVTMELGGDVYEDKGKGNLCDCNITFMHYSGSCNHCDNPACVNSCPTNAMYVLEDGTVGQKSGTCIGCGICTWVCPYKAPKLSPQYGIAMKCNSCKDRREKGANPACVDACLTHCLNFVDINLLENSNQKNYVRELEFLPKKEITNPSLLIQSKRVKFGYSGRIFYESK